MPLNNFDRVCSNQTGASLYRCAQPDAAGLATLIGLGVKRIYKLNPEDRLPEEMAAFSHIPDRDVIVYPIEWPQPELKHVVGLVEDVCATLGVGRSVCVHCLHGRDRTGVAVGAFRILKLGWTYERVEAEARLYGITGLVALADCAELRLLRDLAARQAQP